MNLAKIHFPRELVSVSNPRYKKWVRDFFAWQLAHDNVSRDVTSASPLLHSRVRADIVGKGAGVIAGMQELVFFLKSKKITVLRAKHDGDALRPRETIAAIEGDARVLLAIERTALNFLGRMCGIATEARRLAFRAQAVRKGIIVSCTRKTLWGYADKRACMVGGAGTHRLDLSDALLIKSNHCAASGCGMSRYIRSLRIPGRVRFIEAECTRITQVPEVLAAYGELRKKNPKIPLGILLDNMKPAKIREALKKIPAAVRSDIFVEASGGITADTIRAYAQSGVDVLSLGALTHSSRWLDVSMRIR